MVFWSWIIHRTYFQFFIEKKMMHMNFIVFYQSTENNSICTSSICTKNQAFKIGFYCTNKHFLWAKNHPFLSSFDTATIVFRRKKLYKKPIRSCLVKCKSFTFSHIYRSFKVQQKRFFKAKNGPRSHETDDRRRSSRISSPKSRRPCCSINVH